MATEIIKVPELGDAGDVEVIEIPVSVGQEVAENDSLLVLESDKAAMEIPAPMAGVIKSIAVNLGDQVTTGAEILTLETVESPAAEPVEEPAAEEESAPAQPEPAAGAEQTEIEPPVDQIADEPRQDGAAAASEVIEIAIPDLGTDDEVDVIEIHVKAGDTIAVDDPLLTLESDKAAMEVPSPHAGVVESLLVEIGAQVKTGAAILRLRVERAEEVTEPALSGVAAASAPEPKEAEPAAPTTPPTATASPAQADAAGADPGANVYAGPAVRKLARELGVDLTLIKGSGARGRIVKEDVHEFVKSSIGRPAAGAAPSAVPDVDFSRFGEVEQVPRSKLEKVTAANMHRSWLAVPHVAQFEEADVTELEEFRAGLKAEAESRGVKLTPLPFLLKACAQTLREFPQFNVSIHSSGEHLIQKQYVHIGVAVATEAGLVVPVIRDVDRKNIWQLAEEVAKASVKARDRKLTPEDMQGACFTISSLGAIGGTGFVPIVNAPEVAILGVARTAVKPVWRGGEFVPRTMLPLTLTYDHKAVNGVDGCRFAAHLAALLGDIRRLLL
ncbi:MAG: dihydrolipoyllysine-residue acetyltransferase [Gammaproteobacteria bacterium]|nr:dihydrolipoyllysine-residue acetyltransferase [Acidimicrobiia bacterium]MYA36237.1 dihydrolipoyllysine-residue acetyltransferase [Gammaproteobacteria bacterium]MYC58778.1 dihydrolipoyllysine-residue acetyltransferase [Gammaproteobacteria bacterium]MYH85282.1 dihydrolipoyllysine-residue acetyltransferase [Gammaproteobacteria bacterium]MYK03518.1 dihydrolipoyllysine-residue acetyltransferase [Gammaproteobacteria bacterium]